MKVLHIVSGLPSEDRPYFQPFIKSQLDSLSKQGIEIELLDIKGNESLLNYLKAIKRIKDIISKKRIDLIHAHYGLCAIPIILSKVKIPTLLSLMGSDLLGSADKEGNLTFRGKIDRYISKYALKRVDYIIVKSQEMKNHIRKNDNVIVIPNGINFNTFKPENQEIVRKRMKIHRDDFVALFLGSPEEHRKNYLLANQAIKVYHEQYKHQIKLINPFGIKQEKVVDFMNSSDVLIMTSFWEGSPNVIKEAMACNLPIISVDVGDVKEIISNTFNCYLVEYSAGEIAKHLNYIFENRQRSNGRTRIEHLRDDIVASRIIDLYNEVLSKRQKSMKAFN
jgi:glycosyltransferase involved in cell wall biosynthesis